MSSARPLTSASDRRPAVFVGKRADPRGQSRFRLRARLERCSRPCAPTTTCWPTSSMRSARAGTHLQVRAASEDRARPATVVGEDFLRAFDVRLVEETTETGTRGSACCKLCRARGPRAGSRSHVESSQRLGRWAGKQRSAHARGVLPRERAAMLESLPGWSWDPTWTRGSVALRLLRVSFEREGTPGCRIPTSSPARR